MKTMVIEKPKQDIAAYSISGDAAEKHTVARTIPDATLKSAA